MSTDDRPDTDSYPLTNLEPEAIPFWLLERLMRFVRHPCPDSRFHPGEARLWWSARQTISRIPGYADLERHANSAWKQDLTLETIDRIRREAAARLGMRFKEVDQLLVRDVAESIRETPPNVAPQPPLRLTPGRRRILETLASAKSRLSKTRLAIVMKEPGKNPSKNTLRVELPRIRSAGWIDNDQKARPRGYGITALGRSILETPDGR
jgi:hypothetical protein